MLARFRHVLLPTDFSPRNRPAIEIGFGLAVENRARVTLLHVIERIRSDGEPDDELNQFYDRLERRARLELDGVAQRFLDLECRVDQKVRIGRRDGEIASYARDAEADLIVMTSHVIDRDHPLESWGTISYRVSVLCDCSVLLVKQDTTKI